MDNEKKLYYFQFYPALMLMAAGLVRFLYPDALPLSVCGGLVLGVLLYSFLPAGEASKKFIRQRDVQFTLGMCLTATFLCFILSYLEGVIRGPGWGFSGVYDLSAWLPEGLALFLTAGVITPALKETFFRALMPRLMPTAGGFTVIFVPAMICALLERSWTSFAMGLLFGWVCWVIGSAWPAIFMGVLSKTYLLIISRICAGFDIMSFWRPFLIFNVLLLLLSVYFTLGQMEELMTRGKLSLSLARRGFKKELLSMLERPIFWTSVAVFLIFCFFR